MSCRYRVEEWNGKKFIDVVGIDFGSKVELLNENDKYLLCKRQGYTGWCGLCATKYYNPEFILFKKNLDGTINDGFGKSFEYNRKTRKEVFKLVVEEFNK